MTKLTCPCCGDENVQHNGELEYLCYFCNATWDETQRNDGWIPCSERLPEMEETTEHSPPVLIWGGYDEKYQIWMAQRSEYGWSTRTRRLDFDEVTHWRELPAPPQQVAGKLADGESSNNEMQND